jgi:hypothetical protein
MSRIYITILILVAASLACMEQIVTPTPDTPAASTRAPLPTPTATVTAEVTPMIPVIVQTATIQATVYVRQSPSSDSEEIGSLTTGQVVEIVKCSGDWCEIKPKGFVFRGCTSDNPEGLKCEAKP